MDGGRRGSARREDEGEEDDVRAHARFIGTNDEGRHTNGGGLRDGGWSKGGSNP